MWKKTARLQLPPSARREEVAVMGPANRGRYFQPPWQVLITRVTRKGGWVQRGIWGTGAGAPRTYSKLREREAPSLLPQAQSAGGTDTTKSFKILYEQSKERNIRKRKRSSPRSWWDCFWHLLPTWSHTAGFLLAPSVGAEPRAPPAPQLLPARPRAPRRHWPGWWGVPGVAGT